MNDDSLNLLYQLLPPDMVEHYRAMAQCAIELGYKPKKEKTKHLSIVFSNSKTRKTILKFSIEKGVPSYRIKFYATQQYSPIFDESLKAVIEKFNFKYTGCYGCQKCKHEPEGYTIRYENGAEYFRCGFELVPILEISASIQDEVISLLRNQHQYYERQAETEALAGQS